MDGYKGVEGALERVSVELSRLKARVIALEGRPSSVPLVSFGALSEGDWFRWRGDLCQKVDLFRIDGLSRNARDVGGAALSVFDGVLVEFVEVDISIKEETDVV